MDKPLLQTKLFIPLIRPDPTTGLRTNLVTRPRLIKQLDEGLPGKLTLICAPAGFGKTTLASSWLAHAGLPAAWLSLDEDDNDFTRFWTYFIAALQTIRPETGTDMLTLLRALPQPPSHTILTLLINDLTAISDKFILVLDGYHAIENKTIDQALDFFIDHIPPNVHMVLTSRVDPNFSLARLRANGLLNELRSNDLRFNQTESAKFLQQMTGLSLTAAEVAALDRRTEGWIAGLQMAALSLRQREATDIAQFIEDFSGSHRYIMDYLVEEVFRQQPPEVKTFLLYTSILEQLCGPLCEAILLGGEASAISRDVAPPPMMPGAHSAQALLENLEHANLFIHPLDDQHHWYRYHPLFADLLRLRLQQTYPDRVDALHLSASRWYEQAGLPNPAVQHALTAKAFSRAAIMVEHVAPAMVERSELVRFLGWVEALPESEIQARPLLGLYYVWGLFLSGQIKQTATHLEAIEARLARGEAKQSLEVQAHIDAIRATLVRETGDFAAAIDLSQQALAHLPEQDALLRAMITLNLAIAHYLQGEFVPASKILIDTVVTSQAAQLLTSLPAIYINTQLLRARGDLEEALQLCREELELVTRRGWQDFPAVGFLYVALGDLFRERNELGAAAEYLERGIKLGQEGGHYRISIIGHVWLAWLRHAQRDVTGSQEAIQAAQQIIRQYQVSRFWPIPSTSCYQARLWIAQGDLTSASHWAHESGLNQTDAPIIYIYEVDHLVYVRLLIAQGNLEAAATLLLRLNRAAAAAERNGSLIEILILQAITFAAQKRGEEALSALEHALRLAEPEGFVRIFLDEGEPLVALLRQAVAQDIHTAYALRLLNALGEAAPPPQPLIEPLSERELEVLRRVAAGYSNQEIAQELVLAISTVKKHIGHIYGKLGVGSRTQAVAQAREIGLL
jgi:LuxR family maltose regulon positive regulatory protein